MQHSPVLKPPPPANANSSCAAAVLSSCSSSACSTIWSCLLVILQTCSSLCSCLLVALQTCLALRLLLLVVLQTCSVHYPCPQATCLRSLVPSQSCPKAVKPSPLVSLLSITLTVSPRFLTLFIFVSSPKPLYPSILDRTFWTQLCFFLVLLALI